MLRKNRLFTPGPTPLLPSAQLAMASFSLHHRTADFRALYTRTLADLKEFVGGFMQGTMISAAFMALPEGRRVAFVDHVAGLLGGYVDDGGMALPLENHFLTATR